MPGNARRGQPQGQRHREETAFYTEVMVKRWGKSPPRERQRERHGKPHREQCQIGVLRGVCCAQAYRPQGRSSLRTRVGSLSRLVTAGLEEWLSTAGFPLRQNPAYRLSASYLRALPSWPLRAQFTRDTYRQKKADFARLADGIFHRTMGQVVLRKGRSPNEFREDIDNLGDRLCCGQRR